MYVKEIRLKDHELPAVFNNETGSFDLVKDKRKYVAKQDGKSKFESSASFTKTFTKSWIYLNTKLTAVEYAAAHRLAIRAKAFTNSLEPLNDDTVIEVLVKEVGVSKNKVKEVLQKLAYFGVYGKFSVVTVNKPYTKYWVLNPYLSFNGKFIDTSIVDLFKDTRIEKAYHSIDGKYDD